MLYPELHFTGQVWRPPYGSKLPAPATDLRLHMAQMQVLQPLSRNGIPNVPHFPRLQEDLKESDSGSLAHGEYI